MAQFERFSWQSAEGRQFFGSLYNLGDTENVEQSDELRSSSGAPTQPKVHDAARAGWNSSLADTMTETDTREVLDRLKNTVEALKLMHELKGKDKAPTNRRRYKYDWHKIEVGESFLVACKDSWAEKLKTLNSLAHPPKQELAAGKRFRRESCSEGVRVWRVK